MSPLWIILCLTLLYVNIHLVEAGKKSQQNQVLVINNSGGGGCGGGAKTIVKTAPNGGKKGKGNKKGKGHKIILTSSSGKCGKESKVTHIPFPMHVPHYEHVHHHHGGWGGMERRDGDHQPSTSGGYGGEAAASAPGPVAEKGDRGLIYPFAMDPQRMQAYQGMDMAPANPIPFAVPMQHPYQAAAIHQPVPFNQMHPYM